MSSNTSFEARQSMMFAFVPRLRRLSSLGRVSHSATSRSGALYGSGRSSTALTTLKMAVLAPMPIARVKVTTAVKPGCFLNSLRACRRSWSSVLMLRLDELSGRKFTLETTVRRQNRRAELQFRRDTSRLVR